VKTTRAGEAGLFIGARVFIRLFAKGKNSPLKRVLASELVASEPSNSSAFLTQLDDLSTRFFTAIVMPLLFLQVAARP
jgi:hypothetical protein